MIRWSVPQEHVGLATIDRPERRNALNAELCDELRGHLEQSHGLRAIVVTGEGVAFCAGADIVRRAQDTGGLEHGGEDSFRPAFELVLDAIVDHPAPVIAAVNGAALGAGMQLAVACDLRVVAPSAKIGIPAAKLGVLLSAPNIRRLAVLVGQGAARDLLLTGRTITTDEAREIGFVQQVDEDARAAALAMAGEIATLAPLSVQGHKHALNRVAEATALDPAMIAEIRALEEGAFSSADLQEGLAAFGEKRPPRFEGR
ncbi:MAG: enoyl-CoA hydratase-related protein [Acidimicrobiia bacterium]